MGAAGHGADTFARFQALEDREGMAWSLLNQAAAAYYAGDLGLARVKGREALGLAGDASYKEGSAWGLNLLGLVALHHLRKSTRSRIDARERSTTPRALLRLAALATLGTAFTWLWGLVTGGDFGKSLWQLNRVMYVPLLVYLFHLGLRGPEDLSILFKIILYAAVYKALARVRQSLFDCVEKFLAREGKP